MESTNRPEQGEIEEKVLDLAVQAVQVVVDEANMAEQINQLLEQQGDEWLSKQEEELANQLNAQLDFHIPRLLTKELDENLASQTKKIVDELMADYSDTNKINAAQLENMAKKLRLLQKISLALAIGVVGLLVAVIV